MAHAKQALAASSLLLDLAVESDKPPSISQLTIMARVERFAEFCAKEKSRPWQQPSRGLETEETPGPGHSCRVEFEHNVALPALPFFEPQNAEPLHDFRPI